MRVDVIGIFRGEGGEDRALGCRGVLELVDHEMREALGDLGADVGALVQEPVEGEEDVAAVEVARLGEDAVVGRRQLRQLGVAGGAFLEGVHPLQQASEQPRRVAADLVAAQRQLLEAVEQHRQPLGPAEHVEEGIEAGRVGVLAQQPFAERAPVADPELLERPVQERLGALEQPARGGPSRGEDQDTLGAGPLGGEAGEPPCQHLGLAGPRRPDDEQRAVVVEDCPFLRVGQGEHRPTLARHSMPAGGRFLRRLAGNLPPDRRRAAAGLRRGARDRGAHRL